MSTTLYKLCRANKRLMTRARYWEMALGCRIDADPVRDIQGYTPK